MRHNIKYCSWDTQTRTFTHTHAQIKKNRNILKLGKKFSKLGKLQVTYNIWHISISCLILTSLAQLCVCVCVCVCVRARARVLSLDSCPTLCNPMDCSLPGPSVHRIFQARILEWVATPSSRGPCRPRDRMHVS